MASFQTVGIIAKLQDDRVQPAVREVCEILAELGCRVLLEELPGAAETPPTAERVPFESMRREIDLLVVVGGDGTLLRAGRRLDGNPIPLLGIHHGRLGFLVDIRPDELRNALHGVMSGEYRIENRITLSATITGSEHTRGPYPAINDVVIRNQDAVRMIEFETWLDDEFISVHRADGFIVSTPTGSTAYAMSSGGPVIHPGLEALAMIPVCPHTLSDRPVLVPADHTIKVVLIGGHNDRAMMTCDGQVNESLLAGETLHISSSTLHLKLVHPNSYRYFTVLRDKLNWGRSWT